MISVKLIRIVLLTLIVTLMCFTLLHSFSNDNETHTDSSKVVSNVPGAYVEWKYPVPTNESFCDFNYKLPKDLKYLPSDVDYGPELGKSAKNRILYNVVQAKLSGGIPAITYATHVTADFMNYIPELLRYWDGYLSISAFVPDTDVALVLEQLNQFCFCLPEMSRVSVHFIFNYKQPPSRKDVYFNKPTNCKVKDSSKISTYRSADETIMYPINVCRNAAREAALTEYVIVSDIQLMPSANLAEKFFDMVENYKLTTCNKIVYVLPIFEVESTEEIPRTKSQLINLIRQEKAVYFHKLICSHCQKFPGIEHWKNTNPGKEIKPLLTVRREVPYHRWEPIYIGTKSEPLYNEALSWEGLQDKMLQMLTMCLMEYRFVILDGAFLVHWPGMKKTKTTIGETWRSSFIKENSKAYQIILKNLTKKYPFGRSQCKMK